MVRVLQILSSHEGKLDMLARILDDRIQVFKALSDVQGQGLILDPIQNRLVVLVHKNHHPPAGLLVRIADHLCKA